MMNCPLEGGRPTEAMSMESKKNRKRKRLWRMRRPRPKCCPCVGMFSINLKLCHFYTDLGCICCNARSARPDGRDLKMHLKLMPKSSKAHMLQFRFQALQALAAERAANWTDAICHYEACRQTLAEVEGKLPRSLHLWLLMWASTPLVSLYHLKSQNFTKSIEISEILMHWLRVRMGKWDQCWEGCTRRAQSHFRCRALLFRMLTEFLLAHDALEKDRRLAYYEWSSYSPGVDVEELRGKALEEFEYREDRLCHWLSKSHQQYGDYGRAQYWVRTRQELEKLYPDEDQRNLEFYDAKLLETCGDAQGCKKKIFAMADRLSDCETDLDPEAMEIVQEHKNTIKMNHEFYGDLPVRQGKVQVFPNLLQNDYRVTVDWMDDAFYRGEILMRDGKFDAAVSCYQSALDKMRRLKGSRPKKTFEVRLDFLVKLGGWFNDRFHDDHALEDLNTAISYFRKSYVYEWLKGGRAGDSILELQRTLGWVYGIKAKRNYNDNMLLHDLSWNSAELDWDYSHSKEQIKERVTSQGFCEQEYMDFRITEFIKAWRRSTKHNRIAAVMMSNQLYSLRYSAGQLDDTWAVYLLEENNLVYDGLQARLEEEMVLKRLLATCCKGASVKNTILKYLERASTPSNFPAGPFLRVEQAYGFSETFPGRHVNSIMSPAQEALLWAERSRTNALSYQLFPHRLHTEALDKLHHFDLHDQVAWDIITEAKGACGKGTVVVEYAYCHYDQIYIAYVFGQEGRVAMRSCPIQHEDELQDLVSEVLSYLSEDHDVQDIRTSKSRVMEILKELYFVFIETITDLLEHMTEEDKLVIIPIEGLTEVPFQLLLDDNGIYLFEKFIISISPSMRTIKYLNERFCTLQSYSLLEGSGTCFVVGDPAYIDEEDRLLSSRAEVDMISSIFQERGVSKLVGAEASIQNVLDRGRQPSAGLSEEQEFCQAFVHFAVHGIVDEKYKKGALKLAHPQAPECEPNETSDPHKDSESSDDITKDEDNESISYSDPVAAKASAEIGGIMKSRSRDGGSTKDSDMLSSESIIGCGFDWRAFLVVLSACNSAKGKLLAEGVLNLPRAFLIAGVPCIVASQWLVDDKGTPKLMMEFYGLMKQGRDVATSLCLAMRRMKRSNEEDFHIWGAFNVWGLPTVCLPKEVQAASYSVG